MLFLLLFLQTLESSNKHLGELQEQDVEGPEPILFMIHESSYPKQLQSKIYVNRETKCRHNAYKQ
jgi:hypothetical protein